MVNLDWTSDQKKVFLSSIHFSTVSFLNHKTWSNFSKMKKFRTLSLLLLHTSILVVSAQVSSKESLNVIDDNKGDSFGLTAYGEPCSDECKPRGFPYTWCHKTPSRNGTWIDRDYCSPAPGVTRYLEPCLDACLQRDQPFYWCKTRKTKRGDWDYCSPFGSAGQLCSWYNSDKFLHPNKLLRFVAASF